MNNQVLIQIVSNIVPVWGTMTTKLDYMHEIVEKIQQVGWHGALRWHVGQHLFPHIPEKYPQALEAILLSKAGNWNEKIEWNNRAAISARQIVATLGLEIFCILGMNEDAIDSHDTVDGFASSGRQDISCTA